MPRGHCAGAHRPADQSSERSAPTLTTRAVAPHSDLAGGGRVSESCCRDASTRRAILRDWDPLVRTPTIQVPAMATSTVTLICVKEPRSNLASWGPAGRVDAVVPITIPTVIPIETTG